MASQSEPPVNDPPPTDSQATSASLGVLVAAACLFNVLIVPFIASDAGDGAFVFVTLAAGVFPAQVGVLTLWLVWGHGAFLLRLTLHWLVALGLYVTVGLGTLAAIPSRDLIPEVWIGLGVVLCCLPLVSLAAQLPMWPLRTHFGWRVAVPGSDASGSEPQPLSIRDILLGTVVTAVALAGMRLVSQGVGAVDPRFWFGWAIGMLGIVVASLFALFPALWILLRTKETVTAAWTWFFYAGVAWLIVLVLFAVFVARGLPGEVVGGLFCVFASFAITLAVPLLVVRARGWRLILPGDRCPGEPSKP